MEMEMSSHHPLTILCLKDRAHKLDEFFVLRLLPLIYHSLTRRVQPFNIARAVTDEVNLVIIGCHHPH